MNYVLIFAYILSAFATPISIILIKKYTETKEKIWLMLSLISLITLIWGYATIVPFENITVIYATIKVISILILSIFTIVFYKQTFTFYQKIGVLTAIISIIFFSIDKK